MELFDSHNHIHLSGEKQAPSGMLPCACSSTCEADWELVQKYAREQSQIIPGFGVHPWKADSLSPGWEARLAAQIRTTKGSFVGEAGLDGYRATRPRGLSLEIQRKALIPQVDIARTENVPLVLHCVKAWEHLSRYLRDAKVSHFAIHRYKGSREQTAELLRMGGFLSIHSDSILHPATVESLAQVPLDRILVESDYDGPRPDSLPIPQDLAQVLSGLAKILSKDSEFLAHICAQNARTFYRIA